MPRLVCLFSVLSLLSFWKALPAEKAVSFRRDLAPILRDQCMGCHGAETAEGGFRVDSYARLGEEGDSGAVGLAPGDPEASELFRRIATDDPFERMPVDAEPLPPAQIKRFKRWIASGATFDGTDPNANLVTIIPPPTYPQPPKAYPFRVPITALAFSPDGEQVIAGGYHELTVWDANDGLLVRRLGNVGQRTRGIAWSPDGQQLAIACGAPGRVGEVRLIEFQTGEVTAALGRTTDEVVGVAFHPTGELLALGGADRAVRVFRIDNRQQQLELKSHADFVLAVTWSPDGNRLASGSRDGTVRVFARDTGHVTAKYAGHQGPVTGVAFTPDGKHLISGSSDQTLHRWRLSDGKKLAEVAFEGEVTALHLEEQQVFVGTTEGAVHVLGATGLERIRTLASSGEWVTSLDHHPDSSRLAIGRFNGTLEVWETNAAQRRMRHSAIPGHSVPR